MSEDDSTSRSFNYSTPRDVLFALCGGPPTDKEKELWVREKAARESKEFPPIKSIPLDEFERLKRLTGWIYLDGGLLPCCYGGHHSEARGLGEDNPTAKGWIHVEHGFVYALDVKPTRAQMDTLVALCLASGESLVELLKGFD